MTGEAMHLKTIAAVLLALAAGIAGCSKSPDPQEKAPFKPTATLQDIMLSVIDPNVDPIWNAVSTIATAEGTQEIRPQTDEEWLKLRHHALTLIEASNLLLIERPIAKAGASTSTHAVELGPAEIAQGIQQNRAAFVQNVHALHAAAERTLKAIEARDADALERVGGEIEHACESCHSQFWHPNDKHPTAALDLGVQSGSALYLKLRKRA
jgi:cytochrome c556